MTPKEIPPAYKLNSGRQIPALGIGTWGMQGLEEEAVSYALEIGYRHIDTAKIYGAEEGVGRAIKKSGIPREEIFVTTKLWNTDQGYDTALAAIDESLGKLQLGYVDLHLIHWPYTQETEGENKRTETWRAMETICKSGKARSIGVSNYEEEHLEEIVRTGTLPPAVNQIQRHPFLQQREVVNYCSKHGIIVTNYSPLVRGKRTSEAAVEQIANKHGKTVAQIYLRWGLQHGNVVIPKSAQKEHIKENFEVFDFSLDEQDMKALDGLDEGFSVV